MFAFNNNYNNKFQKETDITVNPAPPKVDNSVVQGIKVLINKAKTYSDPNSLAQDLAFSNAPAMKQALDYVKSQGGDPKTACFNLLRQNGINPGDIFENVH